MGILTWILFGDVLISHHGETIMVQKMSKKFGQQLVLGIQKVLFEYDDSIARAIKA